jgi:16S rRNA (guanine527-N7)-methyltransferase
MKREDSEMQTGILALLASGLQSMGLDAAVDDAARKRLVAYFYELKKWNRSINLVARNTPDPQIIDSHFLDSLTLLPLILEWRHDSSALPSLLDIGTGAGFPGLVLKAVCPALEVTLVEPSQKRVSFLKHVIRSLQFEGITVVIGRIGVKEDVSVQLAGRKFDLVTSRALTDMSSFVVMAIPHCHRRGRIVCMKGPQGAEELKTFQAIGEAGGLRLAETREWRLPLSQGLRFLYCFGWQEAGQSDRPKSR